MSKFMLVNYRYFISGGPEKYMFNIKRKLESHGHQIIPFSTKNKKNQESEYGADFVGAIGGEEAVYFNEYRKTPKVIMQMLGRTFYSLQVKKQMMKLIDKTGPDAVYILHHINKLSPSVIAAAKKKNKRVIMRMSDFYILCPRFDFLRDGHVCEDCHTKSLTCGIRSKCVQNSLMASVTRVIAMYFHNITGIYHQADCIVTPSAFMKQKLIEHGFHQDKVVHIPTFIDASRIVPNYQHENYFLYLGRLNREKGVEYAVQAMEFVTDKALRLKIVGEASDGEREHLDQLIEDKKLANIEFVGFKSGAELEELISKSRFTVVPSIWYDNMPNVILEAFAHGKPVIASDIGSLPEVVDDKVNGLLFEPQNVKDLAEKINYLNDNKELIEKYGMNARRKVDSEYNSDLHYQRLIKLLDN